MDISGTDCALARESISVDLDGELSELDLRRLDAHFRVCVDCSAWAEQVRATTTQLREAPVEAPAAFAFDLPRSGRTWRVGPALAIGGSAAALAATVVVALAGAHGSLGRQATTNTRPSPAEQNVTRNGPAVHERLPDARHGVVHAI